MIWKMLGATAAVAVIVLGYFVESVPITAVFNSLNTNNIFANVNVNGVTMSGFIHNQFLLYSAAIVICLLFVGLYLFAAAHSEEEDTGYF